MTNNSVGIYIHVPFCKKRCAYCSFYSAFYSEDGVKNYTNGLICEINKWGGQINRPIKSIYFGGGTPSLLRENILPVMKAIKNNFNVLPDAEITAEVNPERDCIEFLKNARKCGVNRLSVGLQSANEDELELLGRRHSLNDFEFVYKNATELGFQNISVDLMLGLPNSTKESFKKSLDYLVSLNPTHISAYILKVEDKTLFAKIKNLNLPDDDQVAEQYLLMCNTLKTNGYEHYEISNFAKCGFQSRHNNIYWQGGDYIGIGPSAHSLLDGKRFYYEESLQNFSKNPKTVFEGNGGGKEEFIMLSLRLKAGLDIARYELSFKESIKAETLEKFENFARLGLGKFDGNVFSLTDQGMLVSNNIITDILECQI